MSETIARVEARLVRLPLVRPWGTERLTVGLIVVDVTTASGATGHGFSWSPTVGAEAVQAMIEHDLAPRAVGRPAEPAIWDELWAALHEAGGAGVTTMALAGLDLALWDLQGRLAGRSLVDLLGGRRHEDLPAYGSGINRHYDRAELVAQAQRWVTAGYQAVKVKVGGRPLTEDVARVAEVREVIGPERGLMIDANQLWDLDTALRAAEAMAPSDLRWLEEPLRADDTAGYAELRRRCPLAVALGENAHTLYRFRDLLNAGACDVAQPNVIRVGGITPFLRIVELCRERGVTVAPHLLIELSAQLALSLPEVSWLEDVEDAGFDTLGALAEPSGVRVVDGRVTVEERVGIGLVFA